MYICKLIFVLFKISVLNLPRTISIISLSLSKFSHALQNVVRNDLGLRFKLQYEHEYHVRKSLVICVTQLAGGLLLKKVLLKKLC